MSYRKVEAALESHVSLLGFGNLVFAGDAHQPSKNEAFVVCSFLPGRSRRVLLGATEPQERTGAFLFNIHEQSHSAAIRVLDQITDHFISGTQLTFEGVRVFLSEQNAEADRGNLKHTNIPLRINWRSYF